MLRQERLKKIRLARRRKRVRKKIFGTLSSIKGVEYTGASKIMHLKKRCVFVMWDGYIKGEKKKKY